VPAKSVIVTDNRLFQPLQEWGVKLSAAPQDIMPKGSPYKTDSSIVNLGNHREPNMEAAVGVQPDLIINGQRFKDRYDQFKQLTPEAALVDIDIRDEKDENGKPKYKFDEELKRQVTVAGEIFGKKDEAAKLVSDFDASIARVKAAYKSGSKVMAVIVSKGKVNYSAPGSGGRARNRGGAARRAGHHPRGRCGRRTAGQDGQPDLHRRPGAGAGRGHPLR